MLLLFGSMSSYVGFLWLAPLLGVGVYSPLTATLTPPPSGVDLTGWTGGAVNAFWQLGSVVVPVFVGPVFVVTVSLVAAFLTLTVRPALGAAVALFVRGPVTDGAAR